MYLKQELTWSNDHYERKKLSTKSMKDQKLNTSEAKGKPVDIWSSEEVYHFKKYPNATMFHNYFEIFQIAVINYLVASFPPSQPMWPPCLPLLASALLGSMNHTPGLLHFIVPLTSIILTIIFLCSSLIYFIFLEALLEKVHHCP